MPEKEGSINIIDLLIEIKADVSAIKTDIINFKDAQKVEKEVILREIADVRGDFRRELDDFEGKVQGKLSSLQAIQNGLVGDVDTLKHAEEAKHAAYYKRLLAFIFTAIGGALAARMPSIIALLMGMGGN